MANYLSIDRPTRPTSSDTKMVSALEYLLFLVRMLVFLGSMCVLLVKTHAFLVRTRVFLVRSRVFETTRAFLVSMLDFSQDACVSREVVRVSSEEARFSSEDARVSSAFLFFCYLHQIVPSRNISQYLYVFMFLFSGSTHYNRTFSQITFFLFSRLSSRDMITTHREAVMCVKYNKSFKHVITASENSVSLNAFRDKCNISSIF